MIKVILCIPTLSNAGAERFVTDLACGLNKTKFEVVVLVTRKLNENSSFLKKITENNIRVIAINNSNKIVTLYNLVKTLRIENPDIIHTNVGAAIHMLLPQLLFGRKVVHFFTTHSMGYRLFTGWKKIVMRILFHKRYVIPVAICDTVKESVMEVFSLNENQVECVYNGVDTNSFIKESRGNTNKSINFISVGTIYHIKNQKLLIDAFEVLHKENRNTTLCLVGDGEQKDELTNYVKTLGLSDVVSFAGNQSNVMHFLNEADVYCCTSLVEGLPISVLEAMSCSLPIITTPAGGVIDIVRDNYNGFVVESDRFEFARKMAVLATNSELRLEMARKSRSLAEQYDIHNCTNEYESIYEKYIV